MLPCEILVPSHSAPLPLQIGNVRKLLMNLCVAHILACKCPRCTPTMLRSLPGICAGRGYLFAPRPWGSSQEDILGGDVVFFHPLCFCVNVEAARRLLQPSGARGHAGSHWIFLTGARGPCPAPFVSRTGCCRALVRAPRPRRGHYWHAAAVAGSLLTTTTTTHCERNNPRTSTPFQQSSSQTVFR